MSQPAAPSSVPTPPDPATPAPCEAVPPLGEKAARGFFYALLQFGGSKVVTLLGQLALSWLLAEDDFGYIGLAFAVAAFGALIANYGMRDLLIRRWREMDHWATPAFWMSLTLGTCSALATAAAAPLTGWFFRDHRLTPLIVILAFQNLFNSLIMIPQARLSIDLRFKLMAMINFVVATLIMVLSVIFAALGFGPYSYILPWPIGAAVRVVMMWAFTRQRIRLRPHVELWKDLTGDSLMLVASAFFVLVLSQADRIILGRMYTDIGVVGEYFWAYNLSLQALQLLTVNLDTVLLPSLAMLQDDRQRQLSAFLRAASLLTLLAVPICLLQATLADPLIRLVFPTKWYPAIPIVAVLSAGWTLMAVNFPANNALKAQGRFATLVWFLAATTVLFLIGVYVGARVAAGLGAAIGVAVYSCICGPASVYIAIRPLGGTWRDTLGVFLTPVLTGTVTFAVAGAVGWLIPHTPAQHVLRILVITLLGCALYVAAIRLLDPAAASEIVTRLRGLIAPATGANAAPPDRATAA